VNLVVAKDKFSILAGSPKSFTKLHESGQNITLHFCGDCAGVIYKEMGGSGFAGLVIVHAGTIDDVKAMDEAKPMAELYVKNRTSWFPKLENTIQVEENP
jgi:hypothetical protein